MVKRHSFNQKGLTLVELLATIVIISIIAIIILGFIINGHSEYKRQSEKNSSLNEFTYELKLFTSDIRKATSIISNDNCNLSDTIITFQVINSSHVENNYIYDKEAKIISKDGQEYLDDVEEFACEVNDGNYVKDFEITFKDEKTSIEASTKIIVRRGY